MSNRIFPELPGVAIERTRTPSWKSLVQESISGRSVAATAFTYPIWKYRLSFEVLRSGDEQELQAIVGLFNSMRGRVGTFLFLDEDDYIASGQQIGLGDGLSTVFQLVRDFGEFVEPVFDIQAITRMTVGGAEQSQSLADAAAETLSLDFTAGSYQVWQNDYAYAGGGRVIFASPPPVGAPIIWHGTFYRRCRFDADTLDAERFLWRLWKAKNVEFSTVKS